MAMFSSKNALGDWPYSGCTTSGSARALPSPTATKEWVEKPVASGRYALQHMGGTRRGSWAFLELEMEWNLGD